MHSHRFVNTFTNVHDPLSGGRGKGMTQTHRLTGSTPPPCRGLGAQCRALSVVLRIAQLDEDDNAFHDAAGTWLMGHTERITFGEPYVEEQRLLVDAELDVPCRHLKYNSPDSNAVRCAAH